MTDHELDEMLNHWEVPPMRDTVRENVRAEFAVGVPRKPGKRISRLAFAAIGAAAVLFAMVQVSPKTVRMASPGFKIPFYVEFVFERYNPNGSAPYQSRITSFPYGGYEIVMSVKESGDSFMDVVRRIGNSIRSQFVLAFPSLVLPKGRLMMEPASFAGFVSSGCSTGMPVVGHETIAGHETTVVQSVSPASRFKTWLAPDLACFALKLTVEDREANGTYRLKLRKEAIQVTMNP
jgi:hypothetical protein